MRSQISHETATAAVAPIILKQLNKHMNIEQMCVLRTCIRLLALFELQKSSQTQVF